MQQNWTTDHRTWYREVYLKSEHWRALRGEKLRLNPFCQHCRKARATDVHHVHYRQIFNVRIRDLLSLCRPCHDQEHKINGMPKRRRPRREKFKLTKVQIEQNRGKRSGKPRYRVKRKSPRLTPEQKADALRFQKSRYE